MCGLISRFSGFGLLLLLLVVVPLAISCSTGKGPASGEGLAAPTAASPDDKLLVRTASLVVSVGSVASAAEEATAIVKQAGGYVSTSSLSKDGPARLGLRVPAQELDLVLTRLSALGKELRRGVSSRDVTENVRDLEAELANQRALRDRLRDLLRRANNVNEVLAVESELTRIQTQIDRLEGRLKATRQDIAFSAVELELTEEPAEKPRRILGPLGLFYEGTKWFIVKLFVIRP